MERLYSVLQEFLERHQHITAFVPFMFTKYQPERREEWPVLDIRQIIGWAVMSGITAVVTTMLITYTSVARLEERIRSTNEMLTANQQSLITLITKDEARIMRNESRIDDVVRELNRRK